MQEGLNFILVAGIVINVLLLALVIKQSKKNKWTNSNRLLFIFFCFTLFVSIHFYAQTHNFFILYLIAFIPTEIVEWIIGPLLFLYVKSIFMDKSTFKADVKMPLAISAIVLFGVTLPMLFSIFNDEIIFSYLNYLLEHSALYVFIRDLYLISYLIITYRLLLKLEKYIKFYYSVNREVEVIWVKHLLLGASFIMVIDMSTEFYEVFIQKVIWDTGYISVVFMIVLIFYLSYKGINQSSIFLPDFVWSDEEKEVNKIPIEDRQASINLKSTLKEVMNKDKPFLNENLTLGELAIYLNTTDKKLSNLLNKHMNIGFYDFISEYRISYFIELLKSGNLKTHTMFSLAQESGFKSKATFNRVFKKHYNSTPSQYLESLRKGVS